MKGKSKLPDLREGEEGMFRGTRGNVNQHVPPNWTWRTEGEYQLTFSPATIHNASRSTASVRLMLFSNSLVIITSSSDDLTP